ncbi:MAG: zinc ribbon domain-containing protein [Acidobacteria bacterium]|nr:MAG: zinc ribbon domain-containing protein [Acidobacteriota bacterium]
MKPCRECQHQVSEHAISCPNCGAPYPWKDRWEGWGFEYKSRMAIGSLPLIHVSFKYRPDRKPVVAKGVIAVGQFGVGLINISQFGIGVISIGQFAIGMWVVAQFALAYSCVAQFGLYVYRGYGQIVYNIFRLLGGA